MSAYDALILSESGLVQYIACDDTSGTQATDSKGALHGTYTGQFTLNQASVLPGFPTDRSVLLGNATGYIARAHNAALDLGDTWTFEAWVLRAVIGLQQCFYDAGANDVNAYFRSDDLLVMRKDSVADLLVTTSTYPSKTTPYHVVFVKVTSSRREIYVNGALQAVTDSGNQTIVSGTNPNNLMAQGDALGSFNGLVAKIARYNIGITSTQVTTHYNAGVNGIAPPVGTLPPFVGRDASIFPQR